MRGRSKSRFSSKESNRKRPSSSTSEPKSKRPATRNESEGKADKHCWLCHTEADDEICTTCYKAYHGRCLDKESASFNEQGVCPECQSMSVDGTQLNYGRFLSVDYLNKMLDVLTRRSFDKKRDKNKIFLRWPEKDRDELFKIIDFEILLDNINRFKPYERTSDFYADVKFIYHNAYIAHGAKSDQAKAAKNLKKDIKAELLDLEACPECYYFLHCDDKKRDPFVRLCHPPHDIVWAKLHRYSYWPAKCLKSVNGFAHVRFFGEHEYSNIPIKNCLFMSKSHPKDKKSDIYSESNAGPGTKSYKSAKDELLEYIKMYKGAFKFFLHRTPYKPSEKQNRVLPPTDRSCNSRMNQMKLEDDVNEDSEMNVIEEAYEENLPVENSMLSALPTPSGSVVEGQYPPLGHFTSRIGSTLSHDQSQYPSVAELQPSLNPSTVPVTLSSLDNLPVIESYNTMPSSNAMSSVATNILAQCSRKDLPITMAEPVHSSEVPSEIISNNAPNDSTIEPHSLPSIMNSLPIYSGNQAESDDEVHFIGEQRNAETHRTFNPDVILPMLLEGNPELQSVVQKARYLSDGLIVHLWASLSNNTNNLGKMTKLCVALRKYKSELDKAIEENDKLVKENAAHKCTIQGQIDALNKLEAEKRFLQSQCEKEREKISETTFNARLVISSLKVDFAKKVGKGKEEEYMASLREKEDLIERKDQELRDSKETIKNLEEATKRLKAELEEAMVAKQKTEDKLKVALSQISPDKISEYKKTHYCYVCERSAAEICCINASYCSQEHKEIHAEEHRKSCKNANNSQETIVIEQQFQSVITSERSSHYKSSGSLGVSKTDSYHKKALIHRVSASPLLATPPEPDVVAPPRFFPKGKRRIR